MDTRITSKIIRLCLFDIDQTLVETSCLQGLRDEIAKNPENFPEEKVLRLIKQYPPLTPIFRIETLESLRKILPPMKVGIFTRTHQSYAKAVLRAVYPDFEWDIYVCYEDVQRTKPFPDGIKYAMDCLKLVDPQEVLMVGDDQNDIIASTLAGTRSVLITAALSKSVLPISSWPRELWHAYSYIPDAVISRPESIKEVIFKVRARFLPDLESAIETAKTGSPDPQAIIKRRSKNFRQVSGFSGEIGKSGKKIRYPIFIAGRYFIGDVYKNHSSSESVRHCKETADFYKEWYDTFWDFLRSSIVRSKNLVLTVIPARKDRIQRMEIFLLNIFDYLESNRLYLGNPCVKVIPDIFEFSSEAKSHHGELLDKEQREANIKNHLIVKASDELIRDLLEKDFYFVIVDDVTTSGWSLVGATLKLMEKGVPRQRVIRFSFTRTLNCIKIMERLTSPRKENSAPVIWQSRPPTSECLFMRTEWEDTTGPYEDTVSESFEGGTTYKSHDDDIPF